MKKGEAWEQSSDIHVVRVCYCSQTGKLHNWSHLDAPKGQTEMALINTQVSKNPRLTYTYMIQVTPKLHELHGIYLRRSDVADHGA